MINTTQIQKDQIGTVTVPEGYTINVPWETASNSTTYDIKPGVYHIIFKGADDMDTIRCYEVLYVTLTSTKQESNYTNRLLGHSTNHSNSIEKECPVSKRYDIGFLARHVYNNEFIGSLTFEFNNGWKAIKNDEVYDIIRE